MKRFPFPHSKRRKAVCTFNALLVVAALRSSFAADLENQSNEAKNLARMNCGAQIECTTPDGKVAEVATASDLNKSAAALIMDDDTVSCPLQEGQTTFVVKLPTAFVLDRFTFVNENAAAAGELKISVSNYQLPAASSKWVEVDGHVTFTSKRLFNLSMVGVEARYVKLAFLVRTAGRIAALGLYGGESLQSFSERNLHLVRAENGVTNARITQVANKAGGSNIEDSLNFDFASLYAHARIVYVSSGASAASRRMIDDDTVTAYKFAPTDRHPTAVVELGQQERLHRISALYKMEAGRLDVYLLNELRANRGDLSEAKLVASVVNHERNGKAAVDFDPEGARYVALRWTPDEANSGEPFEVAEINAFGDVPLSILNFSALPEVFASNLSVTTRPPSFPSDLPGLPTIPVVSP
ncbi:MAG: hypothetical protein H0U88_03655, partial [Chthoniobacterales bacterium]|nr:hypothetical protein [Chthoniobacterales bacterium]